MDFKTLDRTTIRNAVRKKLESDEFRKQLETIQQETFQEYALFFISTAMLTLADKHDWTKEQLLQFQKEISNSCWSMVRESEDGNTVTPEEILEQLEKDYGVIYNKEEDKFE